MKSHSSEIPKVSFIVPCYNSRRTVGFTVKAILQQDFGEPFEVIVVDSSPEPVADWLSPRFPSINVVSFPERKSPGAARNAGARRAKGQHLAFIDADAIPERHWLRQLYEVACKSEGINACSGAVSNANPETFPSRVLHWVEFSSFLKGLRSGGRPFLSSSNLLISKKEFFQVGGFSENYDMSEDLVLSARLGKGLHFESSVGISHFHRTRWAAVRKHMRALGYWSGRLRSAGGFQGSWMSRNKWACLFLPFYRTPKVVMRVLQSDWRSGTLALIHSPLVFLALIHWTKGFSRGLKEGPIEEKVFRDP